MSEPEQFRRWVHVPDPRTRAAHREFPPIDWPAIEPPMWPDFYWSFTVMPDGIMIAPVYRGMFGCRMWKVETLGL